MEGNQPPLESGKVLRGPGLHSGIRCTQVGEERPHVTKGRLHCVSSDGLTAFGDFALPVPLAEDFEEVDVELGVEVAEVRSGAQLGA